MDKIDRSACATALAKTIAYRNVGKHADADAWARELFKLLMAGRMAIVTPAQPQTMQLAGSGRG